MTKIYRFQRLSSKTDLKRLKAIIETEYFWCSSFFEMNDPMEGLFSSDKAVVKEIMEQKQAYKICSFSSEDVLKKPMMWGYYANAFKGVAIEVDLDVRKEGIWNGEVKAITYTNDPPSAEDDVVKILTTKSKSWKEEEEYRFLVPSESNYQKIGKISRVYFGNPYDILDNKKEIEAITPFFQEYIKLRDELIKITQAKGVSCYPVKLEDGLASAGEEYPRL